jgi:hypothetical protein
MRNQTPFHASSTSQRVLAMLKIYGLPSYNTAKVLVTAEELNLHYTYVKLDAQKGESRRSKTSSRSKNIWAGEISA